MARKAKTPVPENETKEERFKRLAAVRMSAAIKVIRLLGQLSGSNYASTPEQVAFMFNRLKADVNTAHAKFDKTGEASLDTFTFEG